jgi:hypothetical protein
VLFYLFGSQIRAKSRFAAKVASNSKEGPIDDGEV